MSTPCPFCGKTMQNRNLTEHIDKLHPEMTWAKSTPEGAGVCQNCYLFKINLKVSSLRNVVHSSNLQVTIYHQEHVENEECSPSDGPPMALQRMREEANQRKYESKLGQLYKNGEPGGLDAYLGSHDLLGLCPICGKECTDIKRHIWFCHSTSKGMNISGCHHFTHFVSFSQAKKRKCTRSDSWPRLPSTTGCSTVPSVTSRSLRVTA